MERILKKSKKGLCFMELFLDERLCEGAVWIPREMIQAAGE